MQFTPKSRRQFNLTGRRDSTLYPHSLQFYKYPPLDTITLEQFEELALERLKVLRLIERAGAKHNKSSQDYRDMIISELKKQKLHFYYKITVPEMAITDEIYDERRRDHISHFILRLAYCRREDLRRWFINQEVDLFRFRFTSEQTKSRKLFMDINDLKYEPIKPEEKEDIFENLCLGHCNPAKARSIDFYKVPFVEVLDLIKNRKVFLKKGFAYIPEDDMVITIASAYRAHLSHSLAITSRALPQLEEDTRLISMLSTLHQRYIGTDYSNRKVDYTGDITPELIDGLSKTSFPLCMQNLHETLRRNHHLKYNGRLQYGLFLKGIGLTLEDALRFWRQEFTKIMDNDKFDKQYAYNIRYNYGKEGKRANFSPYSCVKIITTNAPGPGEFHGCPFKHSDESNLKQRLQNLHINSSGISNILDLAKRGHYQIACTRYFELTHQEASVDQGISHPNQYFEESQKIRKGVNKDQKRSTPSYNSTQSSVSNTSQACSKKRDAVADEDVFNDMENMDELLHCLEGV